MSQGLALYKSDGSIQFTTDEESLVFYTKIRFEGGQTYANPDVRQFTALTGCSIAASTNYVWMVAGLPPGNPSIAYSSGTPVVTFYLTDPVSSSYTVPAGTVLEYDVYLLTLPSSLTGQGVYAKNVSGAVALTTDYAPYVYGGQVSASYIVGAWTADCNIFYLPGLGYVPYTHTATVTGSDAAPIPFVDLPTHPAIVSVNGVVSMGGGQWTVYIFSSGVAAIPVYYFLPASSIPVTPTGSGLALYNTGGQPIFAVPGHKPIRLTHVYTPAPFYEPITEVIYPTVVSGRWPYLYYGEQSYTPSVALPSNAIISGSGTGHTWISRQSCNKQGTDYDYTAAWGGCGFARDTGGNIRLGTYMNWSPYTTLYSTGAKTVDTVRPGVAGSTQIGYKTPLLIANRDCIL